jgi:hypothetical protein
MPETVLRSKQGFAHRGNLFSGGERFGIGCPAKIAGFGQTSPGEGPPAIV